MHFIQGESSLDRVFCCFHALHKICHSGNLGWASNMMISEYLPFCPLETYQLTNKYKIKQKRRILETTPACFPPPPTLPLQRYKSSKVLKVTNAKAKDWQFFSSWTFLRAEAWDRRSPLTLPSILLSPSLSHRHHLSPPRYNNLSCQSKYSSSRHTLFFSVILADCTC